MFDVHFLDIQILPQINCDTPENFRHYLFGFRFVHRPSSTAADLFEGFSVYIVKQLGIRDSATQDFADIFNVFDVDN